MFRELCSLSTQAAVHLLHSNRTGRIKYHLFRRYLDNTEQNSEVEYVPPNLPENVKQTEVGSIL